MATKRTAQRYVYGLDSSFIKLGPLPIEAERAPTTQDFTEPGTLWLDKTGNDIYCLLEIVANSASWRAIGSGPGVFDTLTATTTINAGTTITAGTGIVSTTGTLTLSAIATAGVMINDASGVLSTTTGTDGQILIDATAGAPAWAAITAGAGINVANAANTITITATGATAVQYTADDANTVVPDGVGNVNILGGTNVGSTAAIANTVTINVDDAPTFAGLVTAQAGFTQSAGTTTITSDTDAAQAIYLHVSGGTNETIQLHADQGTAVNSVYLLSDDGGITLESTALASSDAINLTATAGGVDVDGALQVNVASSYNNAAAIVLSASAGGIDITSAGAAGEDIDITTTSSVNIVSTEDAANALYLHANGGTSESILIHAVQGTNAASIHIDSDVGGITIDAGLASDDAINLVASNGGIDVDGAMQVNIASSENTTDAIVISASAGGIDITSGGAATEDIDITASSSINLLSTEDAAQSIYLHASGGVTETIDLYSQLGTDPASIYIHSLVGGVTVASALASADAININASDAAGGIDVDCGTGGINVAAANGPVAILSGTGQIDISADATATTVNIGTGAGIKAVNVGSTNTSSITAIECGTLGCSVGTTANEHTTSIGSIVTASAISVFSGTGIASFAANATDHTTIAGSTTGTSATTLQAGTGALTLTAGGACDVNAVGNVTIDSTGGTLGIGEGADAQNINVGTGAAARTITVGNITGATAVAVNSGTGGITLNSNSTGDITLTPATVSGAGVALTLNAKVGSSTHTGVITASAAQETFTITNDQVSATSAMIVTVTNIGANDARMTLEQVKQGAGSFEVMTQNNGGAACNGNVVISWIVLS